jgi:membrane associated rhomboid family serine protease/Flp pilus assembly protein TadD
MTDQPLVSPADAQDHEVAPRRFWPVATLTILAVNLLLFVLETLAGGSKNTGVLIAFGASYAPLFRRGEYWRLVMPMFLHIGWVHLLVNGYALYILGPILERVYGYGRFAALYVAAGIGSSALSMTLSPHVAAGASGAIFGVAGAMLVTGYVHRDVIPPRWGRAFGRGMIPFIAVNLALGFTVRGIDSWGHLGGLISGVLLALLIPPPRHNLLRDETGEQPSQAIVLLPIATVLLAMTATANQYRISQAVTRLLAEGTRFEVAHQYDRALRSFQEAARKAPHDERPHEQMGGLYLAQRMYDQAIQEYGEAVVLGLPDDPEPRLRLGIAYRLKGDLPKAQQAFEEALGKNPQTGEGQILLADLYAEQKLYADAITHYQEALRLEPNLAVAHNNLAWLYATSDDPKYHDPKAALDHAQHAVDLTHWKVAGFIDTLAEAYFANGIYQEAVNTQKKALALEPNNSELQEHMSRYRKAAGI